MKLCYILPTSVGGLPHYVAELANSISKYADVVVIKPIRTTADDIFSHKIKIVNLFDSIDLSYVNIHKNPLLPFKNINGIFSCNKINTIGKIEPDLVHFPAGLPPYMTFFVHLFGLDRKYPIVVTFHDFVPSNIILLHERNTRSSAYASKFLDIFTTIFDYVSDLLIRKIRMAGAIVHTKKNKETLMKKGFNIKKIAIIPHGTYSFFKNYNYSIKKEEKNCILFFGNIIASKGLDVLVDAIPEIKNEIPNIKLIIAGNGFIPKKSRKIIKKFKSNFEIHNYYIPNNKVGEFFSRASIVIMPHRALEGHSGSLTVAYSFGKPVVTTNVGDFPSLVEDAGCGLTVPPNDPKALANAIIRVLKNEEIRRKMKKNALKKAEDLSWDRIAEMHIDFYEGVLKNSSTYTNSC